jgi:hypothetical protein
MEIGHSQSRARRKLPRPGEIAPFRGIDRLAREPLALKLDRQFGARPVQRNFEQGGTIGQPPDLRLEWLGDRRHRARIRPDAQTCNKMCVIQRHRMQPPRCAILRNMARERFRLGRRLPFTRDQIDRARRIDAIKLHGAEAFEGMRKAGRLAAEILDALTSFVAPGVTTGEIDDLVREMTLKGGGIPATLGYRGYTHSCCTSINHVICHGIPSDKKLRDGDIVNIDVTPIVDGWHGDTSRMYLVGDVPTKAKRLVDVTYECLMLGIEQAKPGNRIGDIAHAIQTMPRRTAMAWSANFAGTAWAACSMTRPKSSMPAAPAPGR